MIKKNIYIYIPNKSNILTNICHFFIFTLIWRNESKVIPKMAFSKFFGSLITLKWRQFISRGNVCYSFCSLLQIIKSFKIYFFSFYQSKPKLEFPFPFFLYYRKYFKGVFIFPRSDIWEVYWNVTAGINFKHWKIFHWQWMLG